MEKNESICLGHCSTVINSFAKTMATFFDIDKDIIPGVKSVHYNSDTKIFKLEISFNNDDKGNKKLSTEFVEGKH